MKIYEAISVLHENGFICEAKAKNTLYAWARGRMKKDYQKYVPEFNEVNGKVDAKSFQDWLIKKLKRKINFHTSPKGELYWELTNKEYQKKDIYYALIAYNVKLNYFGRNYDKIKIIINNEYNKKIFDTSCWDNNVRAYRAGIAEEANPEMVKLATIVMRAYNKVPKYVQAGKIFKSRIMEVEPDGEWHKIGSTLDIDGIEEMGYNLKRDGSLYNVNVEKGKEGFPRVNITFEYSSYKVEIQSMVAPMYCSCEMKVTKQ